MKASEWAKWIDYGEPSMKLGATERYYIDKLIADLKAAEDRAETAEYLLTTHEPRGHNVTNEQFVALRDRMQQSESALLRMREVANKAVDAWLADMKHPTSDEFDEAMNNLSGEAALTPIEEKEERHGA